MEPSSAPYVNQWFTVAKKKPGERRKVDNAGELNKITIRHGAVPPNVEEFAEEFAHRVCYGLADMFSGYDEVWLDEESRDFTTIHTPLGLLRKTKLLQGATNLVGAFQQRTHRIVGPDSPESAAPFVDDVGIKGPRSYYEHRAIEGNPNIWQWVWEYCVTFERILYRLKMGGLTLSGEKVVDCSPAL